jgi:phage-related protein
MMLLPPTLAQATEPFINPSTIATVTESLPSTLQALSDQFEYARCSKAVVSTINHSTKQVSTTVSQLTGALQQGFAEVGNTISNVLSPWLSPVKTHLDEAFTKTQVAMTDTIAGASQWLGQQYNQALPTVGNWSQQYGQQLQGFASYGQEWLTNAWEDLGKAVPKSLWPNNTP